MPCAEHGLGDDKTCSYHVFVFYCSRKGLKCNVSKISIGDSEVHIATTLKTNKTLQRLQYVLLADTFSHL